MNMSVNSKTPNSFSKQLPLVFYSVVLDRKLDRTCDVGQFELAYRAQTISDPPHTDPDMSVEGKRIKHRILRKSP